MTRLVRSLFSGGCLFDVGAQQAGYTHLDGYEIDPSIAAVAQRNGFDVRVANVCDVDYEPLPFANHLHVSPSCKNASQANQKGKDENGEPLPRETPADLAAAQAVRRAVAAHQGETFSLENVWGYRTFESFEIIRQALREAGFSFDYWHLNSADYGVPQTRKRLILVARRGLCRIQRPSPTHREGGDMFHPPWVGWYSAIADILHTLPPTKPAPWQEARMPKELRESTLFPSRMSHDQHGNCYGPQSRGADEPAQTVATMSPGWYKAWLVASNSNPVRDGVYRSDDEPSHTVTTNANGRVRAYIVGGGNTGFEKVTSRARRDDEPMFTVRNGEHGSPERAFFVSGTDATLRNEDEPAVSMTATQGNGMIAHRALLLGGYKSGNGCGLVASPGDEPAMTMVAGSESRQLTRAYVEGYWVRMTIQALGRYQTVPDSYQGLTSEINGNGVPCLLAQRIMESLS